MSTRHLAGQHVPATIAWIHVERTQTYGQLYFAYAPIKNTVTSGLWTSSSFDAGLAGGNWLA